MHLIPDVHSLVSMLRVDTTSPVVGVFRQGPSAHSYAYKHADFVCLLVATF
jgi:hypothetical protein